MAAASIIAAAGFYSSSTGGESPTAAPPAPAPTSPSVPPVAATQTCNIVDSYPAEVVSAGSNDGLPGIDGDLTVNVVVGTHPAAGHAYWLISKVTNGPSNYVYVAKREIPGTPGAFGARFLLPKSAPHSKRDVFVVDGDSASQGWLRENNMHDGDSSWDYPNNAPPPVEHRLGRGQIELSTRPREALGELRLELRALHRRYLGQRCPDRWRRTLNVGRRGGHPVRIRPPTSDPHQGCRSRRGVPAHNPDVPAAPPLAEPTPADRPCSAGLPSYRGITAVQSRELAPLRIREDASRSGWARDSVVTHCVSVLLLSGRTKHPLMMKRKAPGPTAAPR